MEREKLMVIVVGIILAVSLMQAFQLSDLMKKAQNAAQQVAAKNAQLAGSTAGISAQSSGVTAKQDAPAPAPISSGMVGGC